MPPSRLDRLAAFRCSCARALETLCIRAKKLTASPPTLWRFVLLVLALVFALVSSLVSLQMREPSTWGAAARLRDVAEDAPLTFHRGFDQVRDQDRGLDVLMELGYDRVLTTGGDPAVAQPGALARLVERGGADIVILVSGGLRAHNVAEVVAACGAREVHMRAPGTSGTDRSEVERIVAALRG